MINTPLHQKHTNNKRACMKDALVIQHTLHRIGTRPDRNLSDAVDARQRCFLHSLSDKDRFVLPFDEPWPVPGVAISSTMYPPLPYMKCAWKSLLLRLNYLPLVIRARSKDCLGSQETMKAAEELYQQGFIRYPRAQSDYFSESTVCCIPFELISTKLTRLYFYKLWKTEIPLRLHHPKVDRGPQLAKNQVIWM
ncbi:hypothetical protein SELMODRAFT_446893 [Selaginella moellendorffii]|uniref:DNA topoisomerase n=1 Tax=Selaginella moellendorffii TaxID=88036 RepID=D8SV71_SELML|nr:hypothetical protein SELMODRAFT_446893 [Selaginella moellendorffii]